MRRLSSLNQWRAVGKGPHPLNSCVFFFKMLPVGYLTTSLSLLKAKQPEPDTANWNNSVLRLLLLLSV